MSRDGLVRQLTEPGKGYRVMTTGEGSYLFGARLGAGVGSIDFQVIQMVAMHQRELAFRRANEPAAAGLLATLRLF